MENAPDLDLTVVADSIQQEVARAMNSVAGRLHVIATVPNMIRPREGRNFWTGLATGTLRIL